MPILIKINPPGDIDALWDAVQAVAEERGIAVTYEQFMESAEQYKRQHGSYPELIEVDDVPGIDASQHPILVEVGLVDEIWYTPQADSRKSDSKKPNGTRKKGKVKGRTKYIHKTKDGQSLYTDASGEVLIYHGPTRMKDDGWLHD